MIYIVTATLCAILLCPVLSQFAFNMGMQPDITFDNHNERFDIGDMVRHQNKLYRQEAFDAQSEEYRRMSKPHDSTKRKYRKLKDALKMSPKKLLREIKEVRKSQVNRIVNDALLRLKSLRRSFSYHDEMLSDGLDTREYEVNLRNFKKNYEDNSGKLQISDIKNTLGNYREYRRHGGNSGEVKMHYSFPINLKVEGFLIPPRLE